MLKWLHICALSALLAGIAPAIADDDQDAARAALARGEIRPLKDMLAALEKALPGNSVIKVEFDRDDGLYIYELKVIDAGGVIREVEMNAKTGEIIDIEIDD